MFSFSALPRSNDQHFKRDLTLIFILSFVSYICDICKNNKTLYKNCKNKIVFNSVLLFHHFIWTFALFGFLSNNNQFLRIYVVVLIIYLIHWRLNKNQCFITQWVRKECGLDDSHTLQYFTDIIFSKSDWGTNILKSRSSQKVFLFILIIISILKLKNYK